MIRYNKKLTISINQSTNAVRLKTDRGQIWETSKLSNSSTPWTDWWEKQHHSELREWQKDAFLKLLSDCYSSMDWRNHIDLFLVYQKGGGFQQPHDIVLAHIPNEEIWLLSTSNHTWIYKSSYSDIDLNIDCALGSILDKETRQQLYQISDSIKKQVIDKI